MSTSPKVRTCAPLNPANNKRGLEIVSPSPEGGVQAHIVSNELLGVLTHYELPTSQTNGRTRPCLGPDTCHFCQDGIACRWKGYIIGQSVKTGRLFIVELTENAAMSIYSRIMPPNVIRGKIITLTRTEKARNSAVKASITDGDGRIALPDSFDLIPHLYRLWGLQQDGSFVHADKKRKRTSKEELREIGARGHIVGHLAAGIGEGGT